MHSIGIEHEGYLAHGHRWYTEAQYQSSAKLVRNLAARFNIPLDRDHIIGHEEIPARIRDTRPGSISIRDRSGLVVLLRTAGRAAVHALGPARVRPEVVAVMPRFADNFPRPSGLHRRVHRSGQAGQ